MNKLINELLDFGLEKELLHNEDIDYAANLLIDLLQVDFFERVESKKQFGESADLILNEMLDLVVEKGLIEDNGTERDLFDTRIMNCIMPRPSSVISQFDKLYKQDPILATDYYYRLSIASNYIRKARTDKNIVFKKEGKYGPIVISINLSKPEKDPKEIAKAKLVKSTGYPACLLCKENVGFAGDFNRNARQTHRIIPLELNNQKYFLQYSPYVYYNEHSIVFNSEHVPMTVGDHTFKNLLGFLDVFPHYMIGSNADLPIVGGSILSHDHYQAGRYHFPIEDAKVLETFAFEKYPGVKIEAMNWPLSTIRISAKEIAPIVELSNTVFDKWLVYSNETVDVLAYSGDIRHNTITPIARKVDDMYQMDLVLRNNRTSDEYPDGIFHPHQEVHHIKKENIGLIEVMGLAILPARLKDEITLLKECLLGEVSFEECPSLQKHQLWYEHIKDTYTINKENAQDILENEVASIFEKVLEHAGVFKMDDKGISSFLSFVKELEDK
ncbi:UDP-glucose--hexose-1-phosphate uridylyltransferase [Tannockella kyphosi]|uniref:UDP-glucose--hexose-1-phosphate uridylyltransferase n=1 Tax=Tannockella kyphosi TaxID=2899121 RepID=UPI0020139CC1|nr:UDP-glucose--hexose-1-phosphate uridylyltransferase [Tannockella kyphosi]